VGDAQKRNFVLKTFLILIIKETTLQMEMGGDKNTKQNKCHPSRGERRRDHKPSDISVRRVRVICCSIQVLQQPGVNTIAASHLLRLLLLLTMCKTGLWKERNSSDKKVTHHPKKKKKECREDVSWNPRGGGRKQRRKKKTQTHKRKQRNKIGCCIWKNPKFMKTSTWRRSEQTP
jgi:hypothetical protein